MSETIFIEIAGLIAYLGIFILVLVLIIKTSKSENRKLIGHTVFLISLVVLINFISYIAIQFILFLFVLIELFNLIYVYILPAFYSQEDKSLFLEIQDEVWKEIKVNETVKAIQEKQSSGR